MAGPIAPMILLALGIALADGPGGDAPRDPAVNAARFQAWFDSARAGDLVIPPAIGRSAACYRYVFIGGFGNEAMPGYFVQNTREVRARGVPRGAIHSIFPSSHATIEDNAPKVRDRLREIAREGPEPLVIVAHSRGACDALAFALADPEFVRDRVAALFLVQGPFGGTALADYVHGEGPEMDRRMPTRFRVVAHLVGRIEKGLIRRGKHGGLADLTREGSRRFWARMLEVHAGAVPIVGPKTYFLRAECAPAGLTRMLRSVGWYLKVYDGPNDGVVAVRDQYLPGFGTSLGVLECGHGDLTCRAGSDRPHRLLREAFIRCILMTVGQAPMAVATRPEPAPRRPRLRLFGRAG